MAGSGKLSWTQSGRRARLASALTNHYGKSKKETPPEDEQAQAPEALEIESPQEAYMAEIAALAWPTSYAGLHPPLAHPRRVFICTARRLERARRVAGA
jgi:hypothetical protein